MHSDLNLARAQIMPGANTNTYTLQVISGQGAEGYPSPPSNPKCQIQTVMKLNY